MSLRRASGAVPVPRERLALDRGPGGRQRTPAPQAYPAPGHWLVANMGRDRSYDITAGRSERRGTPLKDAGDLTAWLDALLDGLGLAGTHLCGHSYGAWLAVRYALHAPQRVTRLALVDPTQVFAGFRPSYLLRALPTLIRPSQDRARSFLAWETAPTRPDETWQRLYALATTVPSRRLIAGGRPPAADLRMPTLVLLAEHSRAHNARHIADRARRALPRAEVSVLPGATHHSLPLTEPEELNSRLVDFLR